jgi:O-antigen/teichoic acid export membrane protein
VGVDGVEQPRSATDADADILDTPAAGPAAVRGGVLRVAGYVAGLVLSVGSAAALLRYLGPDDFGRYATVLALVTIVAGLTEAGMTVVGVREYAQRPPAARRALLRHLQGLRLVLTLAGVAVAVGFAVVAGYEAAMVAGTALWGLGVVVQIAAGTLAVPLQARLRLGWVSALDLLRQVLTVGLILVVVVADAGLLELFAVPLAVAVIVFGATWLIVRDAAPLRPGFDRARWRALLALTLPFAAATAVGVIYAYVTQVVMSLVADETETGVFGAGFRVFIVLIVIPGLAVQSAFPIMARAARDDAERLRYGVQRVFEVCLLLGTAMAIATSVGAPAIIDVVAGEKYAAADGVLRIQGVALLATALAALGGFALLSVHAHRALLWVNAAALVTSIVLTLVLGASRGATGGAIANLAGEGVLAMGYLIALARAGRGVGLAAAPKVAAAAAVAVAAAVLSGLPSFLAALVGTMVFALAAIVLRAVPREAFDALGEVLARRRDPAVPGPVP